MHAAVNAPFSLMAVKKSTAIFASKQARDLLVHEIFCGILKSSYYSSLNNPH